MMKKRKYLLWVMSFYVLTLALLLVGTFYDLQIDKALYNPENAFALFLQKYGEVPRFALWGLPLRCCMPRASGSAKDLAGAFASAPEDEQSKARIFREGAKPAFGLEHLCL